MINATKHRQNQEEYVNNYDLPFLETCSFVSRDKVAFSQSSKSTVNNVGVNLTETVQK